nr:predicted protein [Triticum aestivum]
MGRRRTGRGAEEDSDGAWRGRRRATARDGAATGTRATMGTATASGRGGDGVGAGRRRRAASGDRRGRRDRSGDAVLNFRYIAKTLVPVRGSNRDQ